MRLHLLLAAVLLSACGADDDDDDDLGDGDGDADGDGDVVDCAVGSRAGPPGDTLLELTPLGIDYDVHAPDDYDATVAHPLVVLYSPAGVREPADAEDFTQLVPEVLDRGWLIATVNHVSPQDQEAIEDLGSIGALVAARWCIDETRVYYTGHSDGATIASVLALSGTAPSPAAIAPSAAGVPRGYLDQEPCPARLAVMVQHSVDDRLFPVSKGFGGDAAAWWAECMGCDASTEPLDNGCEAWTGCDAVAEVQYCAVTGSHGSWPELNADMLDFFARFSREQ